MSVFILAMFVSVQYYRPAICGIRSSRKYLRTGTRFAPSQSLHLVGDERCSSPTLMSTSDDSFDALTSELIEDIR